MSAAQLPRLLARTPRPFHVLTYHVPRNSRGSVPVFTDIRNGGTRTLTLIRNVHGDIDVRPFHSRVPSALANSDTRNEMTMAVHVRLQALARDLAHSLFQPGSPEAARIKITTVRSKHLVLSGGLWKHELIRWLVSNGF